MGGESRSQKSEVRRQKSEIRGQRPAEGVPHFVAERLRVPTGGAAGCGPQPRRRGKPRRYRRRMPRRHGFCSGTPPRSDRGCGGLRGPLPSAREAAPLQKGARPSAWTSARKVPRASLPVGIPWERGLPSPQAEGQAHGPRHAPRTRCGLKVRAPGNAQPRARPPGTRASKPACLRGSPWQVPAHARFAALHFVAERLRVPGGEWKGLRGPAPDRRGKPRRYKRRMHRRHVFCSGTPPRSGGGSGKGCGPHSRSAREAAPLQKGECIAAKRPIRNPRSPIRNSSPLPIGAGSRAATKRRMPRR